MPAPDFWFTAPDRPSWKARVLAPVGAIYAFATAQRIARGRSFDAGVPVICIGNINVGGTGKTPTAMALAQALCNAGHKPHILTRGYGGSLIGPVLVDPVKHTAAEVGDEALLLAAFAPTTVAKDRAAGASTIKDADVILLDDGHQNPAIKKDISIVVVDARRGFGNGRVLPSGPLREPVATGLKRTDILLTIGEPDAQDTFDAPSATRVQGQLKPLLTGMPWTGIRALAFAGIGHPEKFFNTLERVGATIIRRQALEDHQPLSEALMARLEAEATANAAQLVTTEKDAVRLPDAFRAKVLTLPVRLEIEDWAPLHALFDAKGLSLKP